MHCWFSRLLTSRALDDGRELSARLRAHLDRCDACRRRYEQERRVVDGLRGEIGRLRIEAPPFLRARILAHLKAPAQGWAAERWAFGWRGMAAIACIAMASAVFWNLRQPPAPAPAPDGVAGLSQALEPIRQIAGTDAALSFGARLDEPLESEFRRVVGDARQALGCLSRSFLPEAMMASWRE